MTNVSKKLYEVNTYEVVHEGKLSDTIIINTRVSQECYCEKKKEVDWGISQQLEDLDFAGDIYMLPHAFNKTYIYN
jgi:hypothetical protein